jgi:hypothetical protein
MAAKRPASKSAEVTPTEADTGEAAPVAIATDSIPAAPDSVTDTATSEVAPVESSPAPVDTAAAPVAPVVVPAATAVEPAAPTHQVVYVEAPKPFVAKGNRGFGVLIALLATVVYAVLYALAEVVTQLINHVPVDLGFLTTLDFYAPVVMFAVGFILLVLIVNRAGWAAHVVGSLFVGLFVFFGATGVVLLLHVNQIPSNEVGTAFTQVLFSIGSIIAALLAREVALWLGFAVAARGRKVKARNVDARVVYDQEIAAKRSEYEQANARNAAAAPSAKPVDESAVAEEPGQETAAP